MPLHRRVPKRGLQIYLQRICRSILSKLNVFEDGMVITPELLKSSGIVKNLRMELIIWAGEKISKKLTVKATNLPRQQ
jgi:large subunit ribosomal protein L15